MWKFAKWLFVAIAMGAILATAYYSGGLQQISELVQSVRSDFIDKAPKEMVTIIFFVILAIVAGAVYSILD